MEPTRAAVLTGEGPGAVASVRLWGPDASAIADACFRPHRGKPLTATPGRPRVGRVGAGTGDEVVAIVGADGQVEIQCHGGPAAVALVLEALAGAGAVVSPASRWVRYEAPSPIRAEAALDLPRAPTLRTAAHLLDQADGALDRELRLVLDALEAEQGAALGRIDNMIARSEIGLRLVEGWRVVLAGRPNVGKSRLMNALVGFDRAIVDPTPGTTRDVVTSSTAFDGWPVELADTAGLRSSEDPVEAEGVARARASQSMADLVLLVLDRSEPLTLEDERLVAELPSALVVANKADLPGVWEGPGLVVSAERGDGIDGLVGEIGRRLVPEPPPEGCGMPFRPRHLRRLRLIRAAVAAGDLARAARSLDRWLGRESAQ
jgi:tRNA modification GTPase